MKSKGILVASAIALSMASGLAAAQSSSRSTGAGWYGGIDLGRSKLNVDGGDLDSALSRQGVASASSLDDKDTSYGFNLGYRLSRNWAVEGAWARLGKFDLSSTAGADTLSGTYKADAFSLSGLGILPLEHGFSVYGKAGLAHVRTDLDVSSNTGATPVGNTSGSKNGLLFGAGLTYDITHEVFAKAGWDRYAHVGTDDTGKGSADLYSVGVGYRF